MFFVNTDYSKEIQKAKIHLAKPNKTIISHVFERDNMNLKVQLGNIYELTFSIPHFINGEYEIEKNPHVEIMKEKMLLRVTLSGMTEWFTIDSIEEDGKDTDVFNVTAFSLGYELSHKRLNSYLAEAKSCRAIATEILESSTWRIGDIDPIIQYKNAVLTEANEAKRTLEISGSNLLDGILQVAEAFGAVPIWDTNRRTISFKSLKNIGTFKGMTVDYGKLLSSINRSRTTDELTTRMYAFGNDDLTIAGVNPTGQMYIEDFSFFLHPFQRDANKNVISHSDFMSDDLCHAILNHKELVQTHSEEINNLMSEILSKQLDIQIEKTKHSQLQSELQSIEYRLDTAKASEHTGLITSITAEKIAKLSELAGQNTLVERLELELRQKNDRVSTLRNNISTQAGFNTQLYDELNYYIIEKEWRDDRYIDAKELYDDALERFINTREPKVVITVDIENLFEMIDEQYYWDKLELGDLIKIKYPQMNIEYMAQIIEIDYDFGNGSISIVIANTEKIGDEMDRIKELLSKSQSASTLLENNKYKWDKVIGVEDEVYRLLNYEWDANKRKIVAGVNNQIEIGNRGIIISNPDNPDEIVIMQAGIIALSKDGGDNWKTAVKPDGIVAEQIIGNLIAGRNLIITNGNGTFTVDEDGVRIVGTSLEIIGGLPVEQLDQDYVNTIDTEIEEAKESINGLKRDINSIFSDSVITEIEARTLSLSLRRTIAESEDIIRIAGTLNITSQKTDYQNALNVLSNDLNNYIDKSSYPITITETERRNTQLRFIAVENTKSVLINEIIKKREQNANDYANAVINDISTEVSNLNQYLTNFSKEINSSFKDGIIEESEAKAIATHINILRTEKADIDSKYAQLYGNTSLVNTTVKSELLNMKSAYEIAHANLITSINTAISDGKTTSIEKQTVDTRFTAYRNAISNLSIAFEKAINAIRIEQNRITEMNAKSYTDSLRNDINSDIAGVNKQLTNLNSEINTTFRDGIIEESEAKSIGTYINTLNTEKSDLDNKYEQIYNNSYFVDNSLKSELLNLKNIYNNAHSNLINSINTAISDRRTTSTEKQDVDNKFNLYKNALANLSTSFEKVLNAIGIEQARRAEANAKGYADAIKESVEREISDINRQLNNLNIEIGESFRDGVIEEAEAISISMYINSLNAEKSDLDNKYTQMYSNTDLVNSSLKSELLNSKNAYNTAHNNLITSINTAIGDRKTTVAEKQDVDNKFGLYRTALANLSTSFEKVANAIGIEQARRAEVNAINYADSIKTAIDGEIEDIVEFLGDLNLEIDDSFRDGIIEESEAISIRMYINSLNTEKSDLDNKYAQVYANSSLVNATIKSGLLSAKNAYNTAHTNLINSINTAIGDMKVSDEERTDVNNRFGLYRTAVANLSASFERAINEIVVQNAKNAETNAKDSSVGKGEVLNGVKIDAQNGLVITTSDGKNKVTTNASKGFVIQKNVGTISSPAYSDVLSIDTNGNVVLNSGVISWGNVNYPTASQIGALTPSSPMLTNITSSGIYTGTVTTDKLVAGNVKISSSMIENLVVGSNVSMGASATIRWTNVTGAPTIPTSASQIGALPSTTTARDIGALPSTYIDSSGIFTGKVYAGNITAGTISGNMISGGTITGVTISSTSTISVNTNLRVGNNIEIGTQTTNETKMIRFKNGATISSPATPIGALPSSDIKISAQNFYCNDGDIALGHTSSYTYIYGTLNLANANINWGSNRPTAVFG